MCIEYIIKEASAKNKCITDKHRHQEQIRSCAQTVFATACSSSLCFVSVFFVPKCFKNTTQTSAILTTSPRSPAFVRGEEAEFDVKQTGENGAVRGGVCYECTRARCAEMCEHTRHTYCCRVGPVHVEVDGHEFQVGGGEGRKRVKRSERV